LTLEKPGVNSGVHLGLKLNEIRKEANSMPACRFLRSIASRV